MFRFVSEPLLCRLTLNIPYRRVDGPQTWPGLFCQRFGFEPYHPSPVNLQGLGLRIFLTETTVLVTKSIVNNLPTKNKQQ
jgi:hypothetical protein